MCLAAKRILDEPEGCVFCPMIDARRMEVFTALYDSKLENIVEPQALVLTEDFCSELLEDKRIIFFGNGSQKFNKIATHINISFANVDFDSTDLSKLAYISYLENDFANTTYSEPQYFKRFYSNN